MAKFRSIPQEIEAVQFFPDKKPWPLGVKHDPADKCYYIENPLHGDKISVVAGDWVRIDDLFDPYPIKPGYMLKHYEEVSESPCVADRNCLSFWFPLLRDAGLPVPRTEIITTDLFLSKILAGVEPEGWLDFLDDLRMACLRIGLPCLLRTGHGSGKHQWADTCCLKTVDDLKSHVIALVEWSELAHIMGLPTNVWAVREMLPVKPLICLSRYRNMPVVPEWRCFVLDGKVQCLHPYWPKGVLAEGMEIHYGIDDIYRRLQQITPNEWNQCLELAIRACTAVGGGWWSVDLLRTKRGFYVIDMAQAKDSYHWEDCPNGKIEHI